VVKAFEVENYDAIFFVDGGGDSLILTKQDSPDGKANPFKGGDSELLGAIRTAPGKMFQVLNYLSLICCITLMNRRQLLQWGWMSKCLDSWTILTPSSNGVAILAVLTYEHERRMDLHSISTSILMTFLG